MDNIIDDYDYEAIWRGNASQVWYSENPYFRQKMIELISQYKLDGSKVCQIEFADGKVHFTIIDNYPWKRMPKWEPSHTTISFDIQRRTKQ